MLVKNMYCTRIEKQWLINCKGIPRSYFNDIFELDLDFQELAQILYNGSRFCCLVEILAARPMRTQPNNLGTKRKQVQ